MDSSEMTSSETSRQPPPSLEELSRRGVQALLLPWLIDRGAGSSSSPQEGPRQVLVLVNLETGSISMIEGVSDIAGLIRSKDGPLPASKASIEAMPAVEVKEEDLECAICLTEFEVNGELAKEMPCKHRYHGGCIEKWLGLHGSCPLCRYRMPVEEEEETKKGGSIEGEDNRDGNGNGADTGGGGAGIVLHIVLAGSRRRNPGPNSNTDTGGEENSSSAGGHLSSGEGDAGSGLAEDMEIDSN